MRNVSVAEKVPRFSAHCSPGTAAEIKTREEGCQHPHDLDFDQVEHGRKMPRSWAYTLGRFELPKLFPENRRPHPAGLSQESGNCLGLSPHSASQSQESHGPGYPLSTKREPLLRGCFFRWLPALRAPPATGRVLEEAVHSCGSASQKDRFGGKP